MTYILTIERMVECFL